MKRKQTLLVMMTAFLCTFGAGRLWAVTADERLYLDTNVRVESITKYVPGDDGTRPVNTEIYFDVKLTDTNADTARAWRFLGQTFDASVGERPYLTLNMAMEGQSVMKPVAGSSASDQLVKTKTAVAYYVGAGASADVMRFVYVVRPGDMCTNLSWMLNNTSVSFGGAIGGVKLSVLNPVTGQGVQGGSINLSAAVMQVAPNRTLTDTVTLPVSGYSISVGDADDFNFGALYEGLVPVTVSALASETGTRSVVTNTTFNQNGYFWVEDADGNYYNVGATMLASNNSVLNSVAYADPVAKTTTFNAAAAARVSGMNNATTLSQKFFLNLPAGFTDGQELRLCYGIRPTMNTNLYTYQTFNVMKSPIAESTATKGKTYSVVATSLSKGKVKLPDGTEVDGGKVVLGANESVTLSISRAGVQSLASMSPGKLYAMIEPVSDNDAGVVVSQHYVPLYISTDKATIKLSVGELDATVSSYYRISIPGLEPGADKPYYLEVTASPARETITLMANEAIGNVGTEYYSPVDTAASQTPGGTSLLEYTLTVAAAEEARDFLIYPTANDFSTRIDANAVIAGLTYTVKNADGTEEKKPVSAYDFIASYVTLQAQSGSILPGGKPELRVKIPAGATSAKFYVACNNDFAQSLGILENSTITLGDRKTARMGGIAFTAKRCDADGNITGTLDECSVILPQVQNRAPTILSHSAPQQGPTGSPLSFAFNVVDTVTDYLVLLMNYGDGTQDSVLLVDEEKMIKLMGDAAWTAKKKNLDALYGTHDATTGQKVLKIADGGRNVPQQTYSFAHAYDGGATANWSFTVIDSMGQQVATTGLVNLDSAQLFQFKTYNERSPQATGYVLWEKDMNPNRWSFGETYTYSSLPRAAGSNLVRVKAVPFSSGDDTIFAEGSGIDKFVGPSYLFDSFFYKWAAANDYATLLPSGDTEADRYEQLLTFPRDYVKDGEATDPLAWQDIMLSAVFSAEYYVSDAWYSYDKDLLNPSLYELGDYNSDGVPDGWMIRHMGEANRAELVEGESAAAKMPAEDRLPAAGWNAGDAAYRFGASTGSIHGSLEQTGAPFGYMMRIRGRDGALNAANGDKDDPRWLSIPAWTVVIHPEYVLSEADSVKYGIPRFGMVNAGTVSTDLDDVTTFKPAWNRVRLFPDYGERDEKNQTLVLGGGIKFTENGIPYTVDGKKEVSFEVKEINPETEEETVVAVITEHWGYVIDSEAHPMSPGKSDDAPYKATSLRVCYKVEVTTPDGKTELHNSRAGYGANYETFEYTYEGWVAKVEKQTGSNQWSSTHVMFSAPEKDKPTMPFPFVRNAKLEKDVWAAALKTNNLDWVLTLPWTENVVIDQSADYYATIGYSEEEVLALTDDDPDTNPKAAPRAIFDEMKGFKNFFDGKYCYLDTRGVAGMELDEPFDEIYNRATSELTPTRTSWLDRFPVKGVNNPADSDGDGINNGIEYYFWYYASRIVYGSVFYQWDTEEVEEMDDQGNKTLKTVVVKGRVNPETVQLNTALWPAIDVRNRNSANVFLPPPNHNTDSFYRTNDQFTMGRRYLDSYDPYLLGKSYYDVPEYTSDTSYTMAVYPGNASKGKGNYWTPISAADVFSAFHPFNGGTPVDFDNDGLATSEELALGTNPIDCDTDNDWLPDGWEVAYGLNPVNGADADQNPDGDYYAEAGVTLYADYHNLFELDYRPNAEDPTEKLNMQTAYYDHEGGAILILDKTKTNADGLKYTEVLERQGYINEADPFIVDRLPWEASKLKVEAWKQVLPIYMRAKPEFRILRDFEVYRAFGFNKDTARPGGGVNTKPFTSRDEFNTAVRYRGNTQGKPWGALSTDPTKADTNDDGVPDGWALYVGLRPYFLQNERQDGERDADGDGLTTAQEYAYGAKKGWTNKTAPTDPWNPDTDLDGLWDGDEGSKYLYGIPLPPETEEEREPGRAYFSYIVGGGCDPNNADTDGDGMSDAWEFHYGREPVSVSTAIADAEGELPDAPSADEDEEEEDPFAGIAQDAKRFTYVINGVTIVYSEAPDPTRSGVDENKKRMTDYDLDADRDGLTNMQEYQTASLRHFRYDLGPDMARIYAETAGEMDADGWKTLPDAYATTVDLANPAIVNSFEFSSVQSTASNNNGVIRYSMQDNCPIPLLSQSIAAGEYVLDQDPPSTPPVRETIKGRYADAITNAFNYNWNTTIAFPTEEELDSYSLTTVKKALALPEDALDALIEEMLTTLTDKELQEVLKLADDQFTALTADQKKALLKQHYMNEVDKQNGEAERTSERMVALAKAIRELDMAWKRLLTVSPTNSADYANGTVGYAHAYNTVESALDGYNENTYLALNERRVRILIEIIDGLFAKLQSTTALEAMQPVMAELLKKNGEAQTIWEMRRDQIKKAILVSFYNGDEKYAVDPTYQGADGVVQVSEDWARAKPGKTPEADGYKCLLKPDVKPTVMSDYEAAVAAAQNPLIRARYRTAMRGFNGGYWNLPSGTFYGPLGWHGIMRSFAERKEGAEKSDGSVLGVVINATKNASPIGANDFPGWDSKACNLLVTNPLDADTDMDGMDDYFEIFHGLNPVLGDYTNAQWLELGIKNAGVDRLKLIVGSGTSDYTWVSVNPHYNAFGNPSMVDTAVTGYDYYSYPWMAGVPYADPDGDGLLNSEEAVNPVTSTPPRYGTDPSPLWMTDATNPNAFTARFYTRLNPQWKMLGANVAASPYVSMSTDDTPGNYSSLFSYEINEGYDTDGDGVGDLTELTSKTIHRGDPQALRTPDRQQGAYFGGQGALQTMADMSFGPQMLTTFTIECWVKPDADNAQEVILIDRPWRFNNSAETTGILRHNFVLGLKKDADGYRAFAYYTGAGTNEDGSEGAPEASPKVTAGQLINANEWTHLAVTFDGARLALVMNGVESAAQTCALIPANGVISIKNLPADDQRRFTYRKAPIMIGATAASAWFAELGDAEDESEFSDYFAKCYKGFIDEVRIWNGARTSAQIAEARNRVLTQKELFTFRLNAFKERYLGMGYFQQNTPPEPLAIYTFNDLMAGTRIFKMDGSIGGATAYSWERFPGDKIVEKKNGEEAPGSLWYRRSGFQKTLEDILEKDHPLYGNKMPTVDELFTSYYTQTVPKNLRSKHYAENREEKSLKILNDEAPKSEYVPVVHNTIAHLPLADIQRDKVYNFTPEAIGEDGSPELTMSFGPLATDGKLLNLTVDNLKVANSIFWSPYRAGTVLSSTPIYSVKTTGNPYGYVYNSVITFDMLSYTLTDGFSTQVHSDLMVYGDVYAKYDSVTWDGSPATDPSAGTTTQDDPSSPNVNIQEGNADWFRYHNGLTALNNKQYSNGAFWLDLNIAIGQTKDSDGDRMPNWWENYYGLDPEDPVGVNGPHGDQDGDFLTNYAEHLASSNPQKYSTVGNGVPDYQIPMWYTRGAPTFGLIYTDNDFMEDHWEASNRNERLTVDLHDAHKDADGDGWSNFAEARANFRSGYHSTNPNAATSISQTGAVQLEMPTPALRMTVDYFGDQNVYTNATEKASIIVHAYTAKNNNSAPDAVFSLPLAVESTGEEQVSASQEIGAWKRGVLSGYFHIGNITPGSLKVVFTRMAVDKVDGETASNYDYVYFTIHSDTKVAGDVAELYCVVPAEWVDEDGKFVATGTMRLPAGTINYRTGEFTLDFSDAEVWDDYGYEVDDETGALTEYKRAEFLGIATYSYGVTPGKSNTYTLVKPTAGYLREGLNNFFVFADLNANGRWDEKEPAGIPDQHDVEIGFDQVNETLHVGMTLAAPPGTVRFDAARILDVLTAGNKPTVNETENANGQTTQTVDTSTQLINPSTTKPLDPELFGAGYNYWVCLSEYEYIGPTTTFVNPGKVVYKRQFNVNKPYLTEDEIFSNVETRTGLPRSEAEHQVATSYKVYILPETMLGEGIEVWMHYNVAVVTNNFGSLDLSSTSLVAPQGGTYLHNSDITFEWKSNVQVPAIGLSIVKKADGAGNPVNRVVYNDQAIRGVSPCGTALGNGAIEQFLYRYKLPRGVGELSADGRTLFGDGEYEYTLTLQPYSGSMPSFTGKFNIQLNASGDATLAELEGAEVDSNFNMQDSFYVRAQVRYNGVLKDVDDFNGPSGRKGGRFVVEAHYSGSFNGTPVASTSDKFGYDEDDPQLAALNRCVRMVKDKTEDEGFFSTRFDVELRGLPTNRPIYLMAYYDLNNNGMRDVWEPWGYATQGLDAVGGFYFDPRPITPVSGGTAWNVEFYIQDVDVDSDKLADVWEWKTLVATGRDPGAADFFSNAEVKGSGWCDTFNGSLGNLQSSTAIWTTDVKGYAALTAYGAQLYGLTVVGEPDANGAVKIEGVEDMEAAKELLDVIGKDAAVDLLKQGISTYGLTVNNIAFTGDAISLAWGVESAVGADGSIYDLTAVFASGKNYAAKYTIYGTATLGGTWTKLAEVNVSGTQRPVVEIPASAAIINGTEQATFFKVILSASPMAEILE